MERKNDYSESTTNGRGIMALVLFLDLRCRRVAEDIGHSNSTDTLSLRFNQARTNSLYRWG